MKKSILTIVTCTFLTSTIFTNCSSSAEKVEDAQKDLIEANSDLVKANEEYLTDIENYRKETAAKIAANNKSIAEFEARIENEKEEAKAEYREKIAKLQQKNSDTKKKMDDYKADGKANWEKFKTEFNHDMEELGAAFKDLTIKNTK